MCMDILTLSGKDLANLMGAVLEKNSDFRFRAKGHSMAPFIKNMDIVTISPLSKNRPETGDIVAASFWERKSIMVHRVVNEKQGRFIIKGDNNKLGDGIFERDQIIGTVSKIERKGKRIWCGGRAVGKIIAFFSKNGVLNNLILPILRTGKSRMKSLFF